MRKYIIYEAAIILTYKSKISKSIYKESIYIERWKLLYIFTDIVVIFPPLCIYVDNDTIV